MDLKLQRLTYSSDGIFGELSGGEFKCVTLEHAYPSEVGSAFFPKIIAGTYTCKRGKHTLEHIPVPFETFEVLDVPGHTNILLHVGNYNSDSNGCILVGREVSHTTNGMSMITASKATFEAFMDEQEGLDTFQLTILD